MNKMDQLLEERLGHSRALVSKSPEVVLDSDEYMLRKAITHRIKEIDGELRRENCDAAARPDIDAAFHAIEKAKYSNDVEKMQREYDFYMTRATYKFLQRQSSQKEAETFLKEKSTEMGTEFIAHIIQGTVPEF